MSELWTVTFRFRDTQGPPVSLFFGGEESARQEFAVVASGNPVMADHYGTTIVVFRSGPLEAVILQDVTKAFEAQVEVGLKQSIAQHKANRRAQSDPELRFVAGQSVGGMIRG